MASRKGKPNKKSLEAREILASMRCNPLRGMARIAMNHKHSPELRGKMHSELAKYVYPQRKAIEHSGVDGEPLQIVISSEDAEI